MKIEEIRKKIVTYSETVRASWRALVCDKECNHLEERALNVILDQLTVQPIYWGLLRT